MSKFNENTASSPPRTPFLLTVIDHDTARFTIEGPMTELQPWTQEIDRACKAGRRISYRIFRVVPTEATSALEEAYGCTIWPPGTIISPSGDPEQTVGSAKPCGCRSR
jgi:hypothetical protein